MGAYSEKTPRISEALGCHPSQVKEANEAAKRHGLTGVRFLPNGSVELTSSGKAGRDGLLRLRRLHDNDGCHG